jgi:hypothetical protein
MDELKVVKAYRGYYTMDPSGIVRVERFRKKRNYLHICYSRMREMASKMYERAVIERSLKK